MRASSVPCQHRRRSARLPSSRVPRATSPRRNTSLAPMGRWVSKGRADICLWSKPVPNTGLGPGARRPPGQGLQGGYEVPLARWCPRGARKLLWSRCNGESVANPKASGGRVAPRGSTGDGTVPLARWAWYYHAHLVLPTVAWAPYPSLRRNW